MVMALDTPVTDQPVSCVIGRRNTGSENMPPIATQPSTPPGRDDHPAIARIGHSWSPKCTLGWKTNGMGWNRHNTYEPVNFSERRNAVRTTTVITTGM